MKTKLLVAFFFITLSFLGYGQKIKYKDLFPLLSSKNWTEGGPQLKIFLNDPKNAEEANAHLQMGLMLEDQFNGLDIAQDTTSSYSKGDSAVFFFEKAKQLITEKELKKNDKYYQAFFRRDLRTGEFGIKVSDVHLDIEKKVEAIEGKMSDSRNLAKQVDVLVSTYGSTLEKFKELTNQYDSYNSLLLSINSDGLASLQEIKSGSLLSKEAAKEVKQLASNLGTDKYKEDVVIKEIRNYGIDGIENGDLTSGRIELWDHESWVIDTNSEINGSIGLLKSMVMSYSNTIREKKEQIKRSEDTEVDTLSQDLNSLFDKYDPESLTQKLLQTEGYEVRIMKMVDLSINKELQDSTLIGAQLDIFTAALAEAEEMHLTVESINVDELNRAKSFYQEYIDSFFQTHGTAGNYISQMKTWAARQKAWLGDAVEYWTERNRWGILTVEVDDGTVEEKVPLFILDAPESKYFTLGIPAQSNEEVLVYGANMDEKKGFIYAFDEGRMTKWSLEYDLPGENSYTLKADTVPSANGSTSFYLMNEGVQENNMAVVSFANTGQLNWGAVITVPKPPVDFKFDDLTQELTILLYPEEELPLDNDELGYIVIDRTGNAR